MNWLTKFIFAHWNYLLGGLVLLMVFICGVLVGESRINREWHAGRHGSRPSLDLRDGAAGVDQ